MATPTDSEVMASTQVDNGLGVAAVVAGLAGVIADLSEAPLGVGSGITALAMALFAVLLLRLNQRIVIIIHRQRKRAKEGGPSL